MPYLIIILVFYLIANPLHTRENDPGTGTFIDSDTLQSRDSVCFDNNETWSADLTLPSSSATYTWSVTCYNATNTTITQTSNVTRTLKVVIDDNVAAKAVVVAQQEESSKGGLLGGSNTVWAVVLVVGIYLFGIKKVGRKK